MRHVRLVIFVMITGTAASADERQVPEPSKPGSGGVVSAELIYEISDAQTPQCHASTIASHRVMVGRIANPS